MSKLSKRSKELLASNDLNTSGEEERAILIVNTNSPTTTSNSSTSHSSSNNALTETSNNTSMTTTISSNGVGKKYKTTNQLLVVVPDNKIVASEESLTTINTPTESSNQSPQQKVETFKTFKTICSPRHNQEVASKINTPTKSTSKTPTHSAKLVNFDQKPLNLPVNELFKRYELKKQSNDNVITSSFSSINSSSLNSLKLIQRQHLIEDKNNQDNNNNNHVNNNNNNNNASVSTFTTPINRPTLKLTNKVPDYFFKDEKEFKKFNHHSNNIASININLKQPQPSAKNKTENL
jgi:hypothetical protein